MRPLCLSLVALSLLSALGAGAQRADENKLLALMPELRKLPAPDWVKEGVRVTYHTASATVPAERFYYYKDHNDAWRKGETSGPAGAGLTQYQALVCSATTVVGMLESFMQDATSGVIAPALLGGVEDPAGAGACWANPKALAKADRFGDNSMSVSKAPYPLGGHTYRSIRFHYVSASAVTDEVYDLESGLLLLHSTVALSADRRSTNYAQMIFVARRQTKLPVAQAKRPNWVADTRELSYRGSVIVHLPGSPQFPLPMSVQLTKTGGGTRWAKYQATVQTQGVLPTSQELYCGGSQLGGEPWLPPAILKTLQTGQLLDEDPHTQMVTRVGETGPQGVVEVVTITYEGPGFKRLRAYDRQSGKLLFTDTMQQVGQAVQQTQLQLAQ